LQRSIVRDERLEMIRSQWNRIVGGSLSELCWPVGLTPYKLTICAKSSTASQEWKLQQNETIERLRLLPGLEQIRRIDCIIESDVNAGEQFQIASDFDGGRRTLRRDRRRKASPKI
jgi:hypothetical protein